MSQMPVQELQTLLLYLQTGNSNAEKPVIFGGMPSSISIFWDEILQESSQYSTKLSFRQ